MHILPVIPVLAKLKRKIVAIYHSIYRRPTRRTLSRQKACHIRSFAAVRERDDDWRY